MIRFAHDVRHALRGIARAPVLAAVVVGSLAIGIGANGVVFSWVQAVVFKPVDGAPRASALHLVEPKADNGLYVEASWPEYRDLTENLQALDGLLAFKMVPLYIGDSGRVERSTGLLISGNYFSALGLAPAAGRFPRTDEVTAAGGAPVVVISYDYWRTRYAGSPEALGQRVRVNGAPLTIVGVAPRGFKGTVMRLSFDFWIPATMAPIVL